MHLEVQYRRVELEVCCPDTGHTLDIWLRGGDCWGEQIHQTQVRAIFEPTTRRFEVQCSNHCIIRKAVHYRCWTLFFTEIYTMLYILVIFCSFYEFVKDFIQSLDWLMGIYDLMTGHTWFVTFGWTTLL